MTAALRVSDELAAWVRRTSTRAGLDEIAAGFAAGEIETVPAAHHHMVAGRQPSPDQAFRRRFGFWEKLGRPDRRSPDRQRDYERRHRLAWSGPLPGFLAARLTVADMAVARIVADEHLARKHCDLSIYEISRRAGMCRKTAKRALCRLRTEKLISIEERPIKGRKSLTNVVRVISAAWLCWLEKRNPRPMTNSIGGHLVAPTDTNLNKMRIRILKGRKKSGEEGEIPQVAGSRNST
jgi:hypothetical protein